MTFTVLRALYGIIGEALDDIERVYHSNAVAVDGDSIGTSDPEPSARDLSSQQSSPSSIYNTTSSAAGSTSGKPAICRHKPSLSSGSMSAICKAYASPPPSPCVTTKEQRFDQRMPFTSSSSSDSTPKFLGSNSSRTTTTTTTPDFPSLDAPLDAAALSETLTSHPTVMAAINRIISACGQMTATVQTPFLTVCDSTMGYHLPSCMRIVEAAHVVEILREYGSPGLHVDRTAQLCGIDASKLAHILRLLATHHIFKEIAPDVFALNRISSLIDSGKSIDQLSEYRALGRPELKYQGTNGIAAFVGLCSDEISKASAYMTEAYFLSTSPRIREANQPTLAPFCFAFGAVDRNVDYFGWLEGEDDGRPRKDDSGVGTEQGHGSCYAPALGLPNPPKQTPTISPPNTTRSEAIPNIDRFRLERFGKAMSGTGSWEAPGAVLNGFDWPSLPRGSVVVDVGGGIGSTSMLLASAFSPAGDDLGLKFVIQDRAVVVDMGEKAWREKCPELLESGAARFQVHDFFTAQPVRDAAIFLLRVVLHDWPDDYARKILLHLREAATPQTKLLLADFVLPLACADDVTSESGLEGVEGAQRVLAPAPLLPNLGKASANVYWMDLTMNVMFNSRERTLREIVALCLSAGWKVVRVTQAPGSLFGYIVAIPAIQQHSSSTNRPRATDRSTRSPTAGARTRRNENLAPLDPSASRSVLPVLSSPGGSGRLFSQTKTWAASLDKEHRDEAVQLQRSNSRCGTPTFGSRTELSSVAEALAKFGGGVKRYRGPGALGRELLSSSSSSSPLKPAASLNVVKKRPAPAPLTVPAPSPNQPVQPPVDTPPSPSPINIHIATSPRQPPPPTPPRSIRRPASSASLRTRSTAMPGDGGIDEPVPPLPPPLSVVQLASYTQGPNGSIPPQAPAPAMTPMAAALAVKEPPESPTQTRLKVLRGRASHAQLSPLRGGSGGGGWGEPVPSIPLPPGSPLSFIPVRASTGGSGSGGVTQMPASPILRKEKSRSQLLQRTSMQHGEPTPMKAVSPQVQSLSGSAGKRASAPAQALSLSPSAVAAVGGCKLAAAKEQSLYQGAGGTGSTVRVPSLLGSPLSVRGDRVNSGGAGGGGGTVASYLRGAGQKLGGILRFDSGRPSSESQGVVVIGESGNGSGVGLAAAAKIEHGMKGRNPPSPGP